MIVEIIIILVITDSYNKSNSKSTSNNNNSSSNNNTMSARDWGTLIAGWAPPLTPNMPLALLLL